MAVSWSASSVEMADVFKLLELSTRVVAASLL